MSGLSSSRPARIVVCTAMLLAAASFVVCAAPVRAQGVGPNVVLPTARPHTNLQIVGTMQVPWSVSIHPATNYVAIGQCLAVYIDLLDASGKDIPRNPAGQRVSIADFDWTATGNAAVGKYDGPNAWAVCACPAAAVGSTIHVMATYPSKSLPERAKVPGLAFQSYIELPVTPAHGTNSPAGCDNVLVTTTVAIAVPGGQAPPTIAPPHGQAPTSNPPAGGATTGVTAPPASTAPQGQAPYQGTPLPLNSPPLQLAPANVTPVNPKRFSAMQVADGTVTLSWLPVPGATSYQLFGAGLPGTGLNVSSGTTQVVTGVQPGLQTWMVGSVYMPGAVSTPASAFTVAALQVTATVAAGPSPPSGTAYPPSGNAGGPPPTNTPVAAAPATNRYRVIATGFRVLHQTKDDPFSGDGHGDEIYGGFMVFSYDRRTSRPSVAPFVMRTNVIGETGFYGQQTGKNPDIFQLIPYGRIKGGTASAGGGFAQNDVYPQVADPSKTYGAPATTNDFPFEVYNGSLTDGQDAVIIEPTLWEADGNRDGFAKWANNEITSAIQVWADPGVQAAVAGTQLALISPSGTLETSFGPHINPGEAFGLAISGLGPLGLLTGGSFDRPIGVGESGVGGFGGLAVGPVLPRRAIVLTHEILEATLAKLATNAGSGPPAVFAVYGAPAVTLPAPPPGTIAVQLFEKPVGDLQAMYILYLKVERVQ